MLKKILTAIAYLKAPKKTYLVKHPVKGTKALVVSEGVKSLAKSRTGAAVAALVAVPAGILAWLAVRRGRSDDG